MLNLQSQVDENEEENERKSISTKRKEDEDILNKCCVKLNSKKFGRIAAVMFSLLLANVVAFSALVTDASNADAKTCDIAEALQFLNINVPCKNEDLMEIFESISIISVISVILNMLIFFCGVVQLVFQCTRQRMVVSIYFLAIILCDLILGSMFFACLKEVKDSRKEQTDMNVVDLKSKMIDSLGKHFTSDVISNDDTMSDRWNKFFIKHDCCAVNQVFGKKNDFDTTPWCTTIGSCQLTNSQIPKSCCKDVTEGDYNNAPAACHATVTCGTFKQSCFSTVKKMSYMIILNNDVDKYLIVTGIIMLSLVIVSAIGLIWIICITCNEDKDKEKKNTNRPIALQEVASEADLPREYNVSNRIRDTYQRDWRFKEHVDASSIPFIFLFFNILIMVGVAVILSWSINEDYKRSCDIEEALQFLKANFTVPCKNDNVKKILENTWRISVPCIVFDCFWIIFGLIIKVATLKRRKRIIVATYCSAITFSGLIFGSLFLRTTVEIVDSKTRQTDINYGDIKNFMIKSLQEGYTFDMITDGKSMSDRWNTFFIKYECCGVNQVIGTDNDFDMTPWCTSSGSCREMSSEIPKTCCKGVTEDDYNDAATSCHANVSYGTYKDGCFSQMKKFNDDTITDIDVDLFSTTLMTIGIVKIVFSMSLLICVGWFLWDVIHERKMMTEEHVQMSNIELVPGV